MASERKWRHDGGVGPCANFRINAETGAVETEVFVAQPSFNLQKQPSPWACLPTSFAMVMQLDAADFVRCIGHDDERGFHVQECLTIALSEGWAFVPFEASPEVEQVACICSRDGRGCDELHLQCSLCNGTSLRYLKPRTIHWQDLLQPYHGVLTGKVRGADGYHAVAWDKKLQKCLDPRGIVLGLEAFEVDTFWIATKIGDDGVKG